mmetsp:Transcript_152609/g.266467  ORF Transcript_152609/g.266467 Transcript_152609/m.266467 type:complete len:103 (-) Transcript_152609:661-969(-)
MHCVPQRTFIPLSPYSLHRPRVWRRPLPSTIAPPLLPQRMPPIQPFPPTSHPTTVGRGSTHEMWAFPADFNRNRLSRVSLSLSSLGSMPKLPQEPEVATSKV